MFVGAYQLGIELEAKLRDDGVNASVYTHPDFVTVEIITDFINMVELTEIMQVLRVHYDMTQESSINWAIDPFDADNFVVKIVLS